MLLEIQIKDPKYTGEAPPLPLIIRSEWVKHIRYSPQAKQTIITLCSPYEGPEVTYVISNDQFIKREDFLRKELKKAGFNAAVHEGDPSFGFWVNPARIVSVRPVLYKGGPLWTLYIDIDRLGASAKTGEPESFEVGQLTMEEIHHFQEGLRDHMHRKARDEGINRTTSLIVATGAKM
jgi:hypothetical protein